MTADFDHVLLTRFNLPSQGNESLVRGQENWLRNRVALFERYCLPSVAAQSSRSFTWIIYFDPHSPSWLLEWVRAHERAGGFHPCFRAEVTTPDLLVDIRAALGGESSGELLTTNLDNDDSLAVDFVARVQAVAPMGERTAIYLGDGLIRRGDALYRRTDRHNAFCSVREPWDGAVSCWMDWHNLLPEHMPAAVLRGAPGWLQVVHGANVSNRVRGRLTQPGRHRQAFSGLLDDLPAVTARQLATEALVSLPGRVAREGGRAAAKKVLHAVAGKAGLDRAKAVWTSARRGASS
jgi:hypothetical protein